MSKFVCSLVIGHQVKNTDAEAVQYINELCACVESLMPSNGSLNLCGDFSLSSINWSALDVPDDNHNSCTGIFLELCHNHGLYQFVDFPTRLNNILDPVLSNDVSCVLNAKPAELLIQVITSKCALMFSINFLLNHAQLTVSTVLGESSSKKAKRDEFTPRLSHVRVSCVVQKDCF
jgi:hypothetical protein